MKTILHLCADTGSDSYPYREAGYAVILVGKDIGVENYSPDRPIHGIFANPPCTEFSRVRTHGKARLGKDGMRLVNECLRIVKEAKPQWWVLENPAKGALRDFLGRPQYEYQPWWYGSPWTKRTALWGKFTVPKRKYHNWKDVPKNPDLYIRKGRSKPSLVSLHKLAYDLIPEFQHLPRPQSEMEFRSFCSQKFAHAFFKVNP